MAPRETEEARGPSRRIRGIRTFTEVLRRQQIIFEDAGLTVIEDFAHHPTAFRPTLEVSKESHSGERIIAVFEPRSSTSRRAFFREEYGRASAAADLAAAGTRAISFAEVEQIRGFLLSEAQAGDVVVLMSKSDSGGLPQRLR